MEPTCYSPKRLARKLISKVALTVLACLPQVEPASTLYTGSSSDTLLTLVQDDLLTRETEEGKFDNFKY